MCKSAPGRNSRPRNGVNMIYADTSSEEELLSVTFDLTEGSVHIVNEDKLPEKRIFATMEIAGESVRMQIDTGASCNVLPQKFCRLEQTLFSLIVPWRCTASLPCQF